MNTIIGKSLSLKQSEKINSTVLIFDKQSDYKSKSEWQQRITNYPKYDTTFFSDLSKDQHTETGSDYTVYVQVLWLSLYFCSLFENRKSQSQILFFFLHSSQQNSFRVKINKIKKTTKKNKCPEVVVEVLATNTVTTKIGKLWKCVGCFMIKS